MWAKIIVVIALESVIFMVNCIGLLFWFISCSLYLFYSKTLIYVFAGIKVVGNAAAVFLVVVLSPFLVMFFIATPQLDFSLFVNFSDFSSKDVDYSLLLSLLMFNLMGWDFVGNVGMVTFRKQQKKASQNKTK